MDTICLENQPQLPFMDDQPPEIGAKPKIIALYSPAPGSGKSTVATHLNNRHGYAIVKFAMPLKAMTSTLLEYMGYDNPKIVQQMIEGELKSRPIMGFPEITPRYMMQTLGTEWGRDCLDENFWVRIATNRIRYLNDQGIPVVVDDMRFINEYEALEMLGAKMVKINRPSVVYESDHPSEGLLDDFDFDVEIENIGTIEQLRTISDKLTS
jgi:hypothetical protein